MAVSDFTDQVQVKVYRSHVRIPVVLLVPLAMVASLYCVVYFYANSNWFVDELPEILRGAFPGSFEVRELVVEPSLTNVHLYGAQIRKSGEADPIITAPEAHAELSPAHLFLGRIEVSDGHAEGAHVRLAFDEQGNLNLLQALGVEIPDEPPPETDEERPLEIAFRSLSAQDCSFEFVRPDFDFRIPDVNVDQAAVVIGEEQLRMSSPHLEVPTVDFRFRPEMFGFQPEYGDWEFQVEDIVVDDWQWRGDGFRVGGVSFYSEGVRAAAEGRMSFPDRIPDEAELDWQGRGELSVPYWSPLVQYFVRDTVHFDAPRVNMAAEGSLRLVDGTVDVRADVLNTAGIVFTDLEGRATLRNQYVTIDHAEADFYGGHAVAEWGYFDMFEVAYGGAGHFTGVNPAAVVREYDVDAPAISGALSGGFEAHGAVPMGGETYMEDELPTLVDASKELAEGSMTREWTFRPSARSDLPFDRLTIDRGGRVAVDYERVQISEAVMRAAGGRFDVRHFELDYNTLEFEAPGRSHAVDIGWNVPDVGAWLKSFGVGGVTGKSTGRFLADGPMWAPNLDLRASLDDGRVETGRGEVADASGQLRFTVDDGRAQLRRLDLDSGVGKVEASGSLDFAETVEVRGRRVWQYRAAKPLSAEWSAREVDLAFADRLSGAAVGLEGVLRASGDVDGTLERPRASVSAQIPEGRTRWVDFQNFQLEGGVDGDRLQLDSLETGIGESGTVSARGHYRIGSGAYQFDGDLRNLSLERAKYFAALSESYRPRGTVNLEVHGDGSLANPALAGDVEVRGFHVGERFLGDVALVANTVDQKLYVSGAALPIGTLVFELPLAGDDPYRARFGVENLDFARVFPTIGEREWIERLEGTGALEVTAEAGLSRYVVAMKMSSVRLQTPNQTIRSDGPLRASLDSNQRLQIERARVGSRGRFVEVRGAVFLDSFLTSLQVEGELDLALVDLLGQQIFPGMLPASLVRSSGVVDVAVDIGGPPSRPVPEGSLTVRDATFELRDFSSPLELQSGHIEFSPDAVRVPDNRPLAGEFLGGVYSLSGRLGIENYLPQGANLDVWTHNIVYRIPGTADATFDSDVTLRADDLTRPESWMVTGEVEILDARYYRSISLFEEQVAGRVIGTITRRTERYEASLLEQYPWIGEIGFDLRLRARDGFVIDNKIDRFAVDIELRFDLQLERTLQEPRLAGELEVIDGTVQFQGETFEVQTGTVEYTGNPENPRVEITAGADIRNQCVEQDSFEDVGPSFEFAGDFEEGRGDLYHVLLRVEGRLNALDIQFESNPYADQRDILSLMLTGCTVDELSTSGAGQPTLQIALGPLLGRLERKVRDVVELSEFTIMPGVERTQLRIADQVTRRLHWRFELDTGASERSGGQQYQLEYKLSDRWSVQVSERSVGQRNNLLLDAKLKYRVPLD